MRLTSIAISNIRSFKYDENFMQKISFNPNSTNLIIGPNASGKSNLIEVITRLFTTIYDMAGSRFNFANDLQTLIRINQQTTRQSSNLPLPGTFTKHRDYLNHTSSVKFTVALDEYDIKNINSFRTNKSVIDGVKARYASNIEIPEILFDENEKPVKGKDYEVILQVKDIPGNPSVLVESNSTNLGSAYLRSYGLIKSLIDAYNELLHQELFMAIERSNPLTLSYSNTVDSIGINQSSRPIERPYAPVLLMSVQERLTDISFGYNFFNNANNEGNNTSSQMIRQVEVNSAQKSAYGNFNVGPSDTFESFKGSVSRLCAKKLEGHQNTSEVIKFVNDEYEPVQVINRFLAKFRLRLELRNISLSKGSLVFDLFEDGRSRPVDEISTGQRAIINIAATLTVGNETQALVLIDEIENHLHPTVQSNLREAMVALSNNKCQVIAVTHSPVFVDRETLGNTLRVYISDGSSNVQNCNVNLRSGKYKRAIIDIISLTKSSRIFFANKILLVEGMTDELFFNGYIKHLYGQAEIEVVSTGDKKQLSIWKKIIEQFGISVYTISDLDGALKREIKLKPGQQKEKGTSLTWSQVDKSEHTVILSAINRKQANGDFVLSKGGIESYYPSSSDKVTSMYEFIQKGDWETVKYKQELKQIINTILKA